MTRRENRKGQRDGPGEVKGNTVDKRLYEGKKIRVSMKPQRKAEKRAQNGWKENLVPTSKFSKMRMGTKVT